MIFRSILFAVVALLLYAAYVAYGNSSPKAQHTWQENIIRTQEYIYSDSLLKCDVVLGTSLTDKVNKDSLPKGVYMLTYPGFSVWDGLEVVKKAHGKPKYLFIEQNAILKPASPNFEDYIFNELNYYSKKHIPILQDAYQPVGQIADWVDWHSQPRVRFFSNYIFNPVLRVFQGDTIKTIDASEHYEQMRKLRNAVDTAIVRETFTRLKKEVDALQSKGTIVYFFGTPVHKEVYFNDQSKAIRAAFKQYMPAGQYHYLPDVNIAEYVTIRDQIHLNSESAKDYTRVLARQIAEARQNKY
ncbi:hypothetical protein DJ568_06245 [Mucilaginibacter hurinus]|uniref:SGNH/GDSL hydrolase family protein n=1 Tax=Mucilaginibacter hurinus TaxID=2201324 RepID=A0A367GRY2_9SPHI|nr:hypothetical protein [Mucilaginibacter hurinus]RCH55491.1 hypothetical protein DJ568_06245 [Mucilaginibacter hurinus]